MPTVRYTTIDGEIVSENRNGTISDYVPDPLGSTVALLDNTQTQTDQWSYMPYGETTHIKGTNPTPFTFVGTKGYRQDSADNNYVRARVLKPMQARWLTEDPIGWYGGDELNIFVYGESSPIDLLEASGLEAKKWPKFPADPGKSCKSPCKRVWVTCYSGKGKGSGDVAVYCRKNEPVPRGHRCSHCANMTAFCACQGEKLGDPAFPQGRQLCVNGSQFKVNDCGCGQKIGEKPSPDLWIDVWIKGCVPGSKYPNHWACACPGKCPGRAKTKI